MSFQLLGLLLFLLVTCYNCVLIKPPILENVEEENQIGGARSYKSAETIEALVEKMATLENMLENKNAEMIKLQQHVGELEARVEEGLKMQLESKSEEVVNPLPPYNGHKSQTDCLKRRFSPKKCHFWGNFLRIFLNGKGGYLLPPLTDGFRDCGF